jgi:hypothetical protein
MFQIQQSGMSKKIPIIFPDFLVHSDVAKAMKRLTDLREAEIASAGFYDPISGDCHGKSETLEVSSDPEDGNIILRYEYFHGLV